MKLYVVAPMTGIRHFNYPAIESAGQALLDAGYEVVTPVDEDSPEMQRAALSSLTGSWDDLAGVPGATLAEVIRTNVETVLRVDGLALLPGTDRSRGCRMEIAIAERLGLPIASIDWWMSTSHIRQEEPDEQ